MGKDVYTWLHAIGWHSILHRPSRTTPIIDLFFISPIIDLKWLTEYIFAYKYLHVITMSWPTTKNCWSCTCAYHFYCQDKNRDCLHIISIAQTRVRDWSVDSSRTYQRTMHVYGSEMQQELVDPSTGSIFWDAATGWPDGDHGSDAACCMLHAAPYRPCMVKPQTMFIMVLQAPTHRLAI
jgi:hypothetical protein